ncbi:MAG: hypothetical protein PVF93_00725 [Chromatiaceae bacterium]
MDAPSGYAEDAACRHANLLDSAAQAGEFVASHVRAATRLARPPDVGRSAAGFRVARSL